MTVTYKIVDFIGVLSKRTVNGEEWTKEVNTVKWNNNTVKVDIREWSADHSRMSRGITLTDEEAERLLALLKERYEA